MEEMHTAVCIAGRRRRTSNRAMTHQLSKRGSRKPSNRILAEFRAFGDFPRPTQAAITKASKTSPARLRVLGTSMSVLGLAKYSPKNAKRMTTRSKVTIECSRGKDKK